MERAGYLLVGGKSLRMGLDKAFLPCRGSTLAGYIAGQIAAAAGSVTLIGPPETYGKLEFRVIPDLWQGCGPLGGIATALRDSQADWNLVLACDMPSVTAGFLDEVLRAAIRSNAACLMPAGTSGRPEPLCGAYHVRCLPYVESALSHGVRKVTQAMAAAGLEIRAFSDDLVFRNCNTPEEWSAFIKEDAANGNLDEG